MGKPGKKSRLHWWIILGMILGALAGTYVHYSEYEEAHQEAIEKVLHQEAPDFARQGEKEKTEDPPG